MTGVFEQDSVCGRNTQGAKAEFMKLSDRGSKWFRANRKIDLFNNAGVASSENPVTTD